MEIRPIANDAEARAAAHLMCDSEPWITLGRTFENTYAAVTNPASEGHVAGDEGAGVTEVIGLVLLAMNVPLIKGYIGALAVHPAHRGRGVGTALVRFAEERTFVVSPNLFLTVSSFNPGARRLYERLGFVEV